jgi:diketogulonate reductase-like aldo/keto reductase
MLLLTADRHGREEFGINETLDQLGLDYLDLFLVHWPVGNSTGSNTYDHVQVRDHLLNHSLSVSNIPTDLERNGEASTPNSRYPLHRTFKFLPFSGG